MKSGVQIRGDGVAGRCCAHLLARTGVEVSMAAESRPRLPAIVLSEPAQKLIAETFGLAQSFADLPRIRKRIVAWTPGQEVAALEHSAVVISEEALLGRLQVAAGETELADPAWAICAAKPLPADVAEHRFGARFAATIPVQLKATAEPESCWMESLAEGWLFLITTGAGSGLLAAAGARPEQLLGGSTLVRAQIEEAGAATAAFAASPRVATPLAGAGWIACGTAALSFDPLCGDGTAHAVREGILAAAVVKAAMRGGDVGSLISHYDGRLTAGFLRHLLHCLEYYSKGHGGAWWEAEAAATKRGIEWCSGRMGGEPRFRYRLNGFDLEAVE